VKDITQAQIQALLATLPTLSAQEQESLLADLDALETQMSLKLARDDFLAFCKRVYPGFKEGPHHRFLKPILHKVLTGEEDRVTVSMPPRFGKSETIAYLFVAWYLGHNPTHHIIMTTHTADLSATFGRKIRDLIDSPVYAEIFPDTVVSRDKAAAANWLTTQNGKYLAIGIGANVAGHGAHLLIADDLVSENAMLANPKAAFEMAFEYMQIGPMQRLMPGGKIVMIGTRWGALDPIGKVLQWAQDNPTSSQWTEIRFPAILPSGKSLWPEQWPIEQLQAKKASLMPQQWSAQYQQEPTAEEGALIKREWWRVWDKEDPPEVEYVIQAWDTAHESKTKADYSACVTMGIWYTEDRESRAILLNCIRGQWEFPELKLRVMEQWKEWQPDSLIVEKKAAGAPLIQELNRMNIVVSSVSPSRKGLGVSNDKYARMNSISDLFSSGMVYMPDKRWAWEVVDEVAAFPFGANDDRADCVQMCLARYRTGGFIRLPSDYQDEDDGDFRTRQKAYYGL
jgi:predicted phage terminase large subunit-like protein